MIQRFLSVDFSELAGIVREIIADPSSNIQAAWLLLGLVTLLVILIFLVVLAFVVGRDEGEETASEEAEGEEDEFAEYEDVGPAPSEAAAIAAAEGPSPKRKPARRGAAALFWIGTLLVVWLVTGYGTSLPYVCTSCHAGSPHGVAAAGTDSHDALACLACHESGGVVAPVAAGVPSRVAHVVTGMVGSRPYPYSRVSNGACLVCHSATAAKASVVESVGVKVSHAEPLAAGAACTDCHRLTGGRVGPVQDAMDTCIRCHDAKTASAECTVCHVKDISVAVNGGVRAPAAASVLIPTPDCGGCHVQTTCDKCHGMRMPHTAQFMQYAHARAYVENYWFGDGKLCQRCHTATRRPCSKCHGTAFPAHNKSLAQAHRLADPTGRACIGCHNTPFMANRNFCVDLCHRPGQTGATQ